MHLDSLLFSVDDGSIVIRVRIVRGKADVKIARYESAGIFCP
jgi:hypothetical protein